MNKLDVTKFNWKEIFSNNTGKTSGSGFSGVITVVVGLLGFLSGVVMHFTTNFAVHGSTVISASITLVGIGAALLGVRKIWKDKDSIQINGADSEKEQLLKS